VAVRVPPAVKTEQGSAQFNASSPKFEAPPSRLMSRIRRCGEMRGSELKWRATASSGGDRSKAPTATYQRLHKNSYIHGDEEARRGGKVANHERRPGSRRYNRSGRHNAPRPSQRGSRPWTGWSNDASELAKGEIIRLPSTKLEKVDGEVRPILRDQLLHHF
jgi:hypothetical protein